MYAALTACERPFESRVTMENVERCHIQTFPHNNIKYFQLFKLNCGYQPPAVESALRLHSISWPPGGDDSSGCIAFNVQSDLTLRPLASRLLHYGMNHFVMVGFRGGATE